MDDDLLVGSFGEDLFDCESGMCVLKTRFSLEAPGGEIWIDAEVEFDVEKFLFDDDSDGSGS